jgi:hypothetical protein
MGCTGLHPCLHSGKSLKSPPDSIVYGEVGWDFLWDYTAAQLLPVSIPTFFFSLQVLTPAFFLVNAVHGNLHPGSQSQERSQSIETEMKWYDAIRGNGLKNQNCKYAQGFKRKQECNGENPTKKGKQNE